VGRRADAGKAEWFGEDDLSPDARPAMAALREMGLWVGVAGNQTAHAASRNAGVAAQGRVAGGDWMAVCWFSRSWACVNRDWTAASMAAISCDVGG
jgi:hypothetical protein